ncbi:hypothetical protein Tco_1045535, partial [Tanacetum coccineum]
PPGLDYISYTWAQALLQIEVCVRDDPGYLCCIVLSSLSVLRKIDSYGQFLLVDIQQLYNCFPTVMLVGFWREIKVKPFRALDIPFRSGRCTEPSWGRCPQQGALPLDPARGRGLLDPRFSVMVEFILAQRQVGAIRGTANTAAPTSVVRNTLGKEPVSQDPGRLISDEALRECRDRNYHPILPIIAEKVHQEKVQQEKLKAIKARLNFEETSRHSESGTPNI